MRIWTKTARNRFAAAIFFLLSVLVGPAAVFAQQMPAPHVDAPHVDASQVDASGVEVSDAVIAAALSGGPEAEAVVDAYLRADGADARSMTDRGVALILALQRGAARLDPIAVMSAADRVAALVTDRLITRSVMRLDIDTDYRPPESALALDFGPPDGSVQPGFESILPGDPRLSGAALRALRRPAEDALLSDGVAGIERLDIPIPDGTYRIILMTEPKGEPRSMGSPFGFEVVIDGVVLKVAEAQPDAWVEQAVLTRRAAIMARAEATGQPAAGVVPGAGGALLLEGAATSGRLVVEFKQHPARTTYLTGLVVEPIDEESSLWRSSKARASALALDEQLNMEGELLSAIAALLETVTPAAGPQAALNLPEIIIEPQNSLSPS